MSLYHPNDSKDNCGFGLIAHTQGEPSHRLVSTAIEGLDRMQHRGGIAADGITGDGCGLLMQKPDAFFQQVAADNGWNLSHKYGVGVVFLNQDTALAEAARVVLTEELEKETLNIVGWRVVPTDETILGHLAAS